MTLRGLCRSRRAGAVAARLARHWPKLRAVILAYFIVWNVLAAVPFTGGDAPERFHRPLVRAEAARWAGFLNSLGVETDPARLIESYRRFARTVESTRSVVLAPIRWWFDLTQTSQSWRLFGTPRERPSALSIEVTRRRGADERQEVLYTSRDDRYRWLASTLEYRRVRAAYTPAGGRPPGTYPGFAARVSERVFRELPDAERVTFSFIESHTTLPHEPPDPDTQRTHVLELRRPER